MRVSLGFVWLGGARRRMGSGAGRLRAHRQAQQRKQHNAEEHEQGAPNPSAQSADRSGRGTSSSARHIAAHRSAMNSSSVGRNGGRDRGRAKDSRVSAGLGVEFGGKEFRRGHVEPKMTAIGPLVTVAVPIEISGKAPSAHFSPETLTPTPGASSPLSGWYGTLARRAASALSLRAKPEPLQKRYRRLPPRRSGHSAARRRRARSRRRQANRRRNRCDRGSSCW